MEFNELKEAYHAELRRFPNVDYGDFLELENRYISALIQERDRQMKTWKRTQISFFTDLYKETTCHRDT